MYFIFVSLYPNIIISEGLVVLSDSVTQPVLFIADFVFNNEFEFCGHYFKQIYGAAMDVPFNHISANIYMTHLGYRPYRNSRLWVRMSTLWSKV